MNGGTEEVGSWLRVVVCGVVCGVWSGDWGVGICDRWRVGL